MQMIVRALVGAVASLVMLGGLAAFGLGAGIVGIWFVLLGGVGLIAVVFEQTRYRRESAVSPDARADPGGIAPDGLGPGFESTNEVFVDPTTGRRMRVYVDPASGERRYRPEA